MRFTLRRWARVAAVLAVAVVIQVAVVADLPVFGAVGDLMLVLAVAAGSVGGSDRGAIYGFATGLTYDLLLDTPFGLSALVYVVVGYGVGAIGAWMTDQGPWFHLVVAFVSGLVAVGLTVLVARVLGLAYPADDVVRAAVVVAAWNAALILPARRVLRWAMGPSEPETFWMALP